MKRSVLWKSICEGLDKEREVLHKRIEQRSMIVQSEEFIRIMNNTINAIVCYKNGECSRINLIDHLKNFLELPEDVVEHVNIIIDL